MYKINVKFEGPLDKLFVDGQIYRLKYVKILELNAFWSSRPGFIQSFFDRTDNTWNSVFDTRENAESAELALSQLLPAELPISDVAGMKQYEIDNGILVTRQIVPS